ncbi:peptidase M6 [Nitzschia inconspicua]|uniref:Peptidase M6 n=1 Tax=Nitzschia inconspicua TaxID=303405 RepID=A0A9K3Q165_9STRA|nr:peptidase M6 [Nitzschia inconspicua]
MKALFAALLFLGSTCVEAAPASPFPNVYEQPDGSKTPYLYLNGDERYAWLHDEEGYTVMVDESGWYVYAQSDGNGGLESAGARVGKVKPEKLNLEKYLLHETAFEQQDEEREETRRRRLKGMEHQQLCDEPPCHLKQLALLVRFADHADRKLPAPEEIDVFFNHNGPKESGTASTGSVADVYRANSFDNFVIDTHVTPWITISKEEKYAAQGKNGFNFKETRECWAEALKKYADQDLAEGGLARFDDDGDGYIDALAIVTSGVAAEVNELDCETKAPFNQRIWSHAAPKAPNFEFLSENNIRIGKLKVGRFYVISGVYSSCPPTGPGGQFTAPRIATAVHELGHFLNLPDLYGKPGKSRGIGNWGFMGNMYGWDASQNWPSLLSAYSRHMLGWVQVVDVNYSQTITVISSCDSDKVYKISHRCASDSTGEEYFLIENRGACGYDLRLLQGNEDRQGIVIWHVDHTMLLGQNTDGSDVIQNDSHRAPSDPSWPGIHSRLSLLPADGKFELEKNMNTGNAGDAFRRDVADVLVAHTISNTGIKLNGGLSMSYPNTNSIATGVEKKTGITIEILDSAKYAMRVKITLEDENGNVITQPPPSTPSPTKGPVPSLPQLTPVPGGGNGGNSGIQGGSAQGKSMGIESAATNAPAKTGSEETTRQSSFTCSNFPSEQFTVTGVGKDPFATIHRECQFISNNPSEREETFCNAIDERTNQNVYMKCQKECPSITGCT